MGETKDTFETLKSTPVSIRELYELGQKFIRNTMSDAGLELWLLIIH